MQRYQKRIDGGKWKKQNKIMKKTDVILGEHKMRLRVEEMKVDTKSTLSIFLFHSNVKQMNAKTDDGMLWIVTYFRGLN